MGSYNNIFISKIKLPKLLILSVQFYCVNLPYSQSQSNKNINSLEISLYMCVCY